MSLKGGPELRARLRAIKESFKPVGREWADDTAQIMRGRVAPYRKSGRLDRSIRRKNASMKKATVAAHHSAFFVDAGTKAHDIRPKNKRSLHFQGHRGPVFTKRVRHPRVAPRPFRKEASQEALRKNPLANRIVESWNRARL